MVSNSLVTLAFVCAFAFAFVCALDFEQVLDFNKFVHKYEKLYNSNEYDNRMKVFQQNQQRIKELNTRGQNAVFGNTKFSDMSSEEFKRVYLMKPTNAIDLRAMFTANGKLVVADANSNNGSIPSSADWRTKGAVTAVKNQGACGSCWTFSTTGNIEGRWFLAGHSLVALSEQNLMDCDHTCGSQGCDLGCDGGFMINAYTYLISIGGGIATEASYPYEGFDDTCRNKTSTIGAKISSYDVLPTDENVIAAYLAEHGPVSVALNANLLQFYQSGVLNPTAKECDPAALDHAVLLVGYGTENNQPYWIVKNSWGPNWGEEGYFRIARGTGACGINTAACSAVV